jgi:transcriptional regulator with XRE-family HTH domain
MNQEKIGKFIAERRKNIGFTQAQLAEKLNITDRAVSKWETGKSLPDASVMLALCALLQITVNDLLSGEIVSAERYDKQMENHLLDVVIQKRESDKRLLRAEMVIVALGLFFLLISVLAVVFVPMKEWQAVVLVLASVLPLLCVTPFLLKIEQTAGYYTCEKCGHTYVPQYKHVFFAPHLSRKRKMPCSQCKQKSWHEKVLSKEENKE